MTASPSRATYRGVRWRRDAAGTTAWFNDGIKRWVRWYPGADAPPLPPRWAAESAPPPPRLVRPGWRSPYRIVPLVLLAFILVIGTYQALRTTSDPAATEAKAAQALVGRCLASDGELGGHPLYRPRPVPCSGPVAAVEVRAVRPGTPGGPACPQGTTPTQIPTVGVRYPHTLCLTPLRDRL